MNSLGEYDLLRSVRLYELLVSPKWWVAMTKSCEPALLIKARTAPPFTDLPDWGERLAADLEGAVHRPGQLRVGRVGLNSEYPFERSYDAARFQGESVYGVLPLPNANSVDVGTLIEILGAPLPVPAALEVIGQVAAAFEPGPGIPPDLQKRTIIVSSYGHAHVLPRLPRLEEAEAPSWLGSEWVTQLGLPAPESLPGVVLDPSSEVSRKVVEMAWRMPGRPTPGPQALPFLLGTALIDLVTGVDKERPLRQKRYIRQALRDNALPLPSALDQRLWVLDQLIGPAISLDPTKRPTIGRFRAELDRLRDALHGGRQLVQCHQNCL